MAEKKTSGFRTFLLVIVTLALALVFCMAAYLIFVPNSTIFGLKYVSNVNKEFITVGGAPTIRFSDYNKIVINAENGLGHTNIRVTCDARTDIVSSQIIFSKCTRGFMHTDSKSEYQVAEPTVSGGVLTINISEPNYDVLRITNNTILWLNVLSTHDSLSGVALEINTGSGSVTFGGASNTTATPKPLALASAKVVTKSGAIKVDERASVSNAMDFVTDTGNINILSNQNLGNAKLLSQSGKINAKDVAGNVQVTTQKSHVTLGNIQGNLSLDMQNSVLDVKDVSGNVTATNKILFSSIRLGVVNGNLTLSHDGSDFSADIKRTNADVHLHTGNRSINIAEINGTATIITQNAAVSFKKLATNNSVLSVTTQGGRVNAHFEKVEGPTNTIVTNTGAIFVKFGASSNYNLNAASTSGRVYCAWIDDTTNPVVNKQIGNMSANILSLSSQRGNINIERLI